MAIFNIEDIMAYNLDDEVVCLDCIKPKEYEELTQDQVITKEEIEEKEEEEIIFCDRCLERI